MISYCRWSIIWYLSVIMYLVAVQVSAQTPSTDAAARTWNIVPATQYAAMSWEGRNINLLEVGVEAQTVSRYAIGFYAQESNGKGRSAGSHYDASGWRMQGTVPVWREGDAHPGLFLVGEYISNDAEMRVASTMTTSRAMALANTAGLRLCGELHREPVTWRAQAGVYQTAVEEDDLPSTQLAGVGVDLPLSHQLQGQMDLVGYHDAYCGDSYSTELRAVITYQASERGSITIGGSLFPQGIPFGGSLFAPASSIGAVYGGSTAVSRLRDETMGYLTIAGEITF